MRNKKIITVTVGIVALNEEKNIGNLIRSILRQKEKNYKILEIIVYSDGSTDNTAKEVLCFNDKRIRVISGRIRQGKAMGLNRILKQAKGDAMITIDADVVPKSNRTFANLAKIIDSSKNVGLVSGRAEPKEGKTFVEKCVNISFEAYDQFKSSLKGGNTPYAAEGRLMLIGRQFMNKISIPSSMYAIDNYLYFLCKTKGFKFKYVKSAAVLYRSPSTLAEQIKQNTRFVSRDIMLKAIFGEIVSSEYKIPNNIKYRIFFKVFLHNPIYSICIFLINIYCKMKARSISGNDFAKWPIANSTKGGIVNYV